MEREDLVDSRIDVIRNLMQLYRYTKSDIEEERNFALNCLKRGKWFVVEKIGDKLLFGPSRFVGYKNNTIELHSDNYGDGKQTNYNYEDLGLYTKLEQSDYLNQEFKYFLDEFGLSKSSDPHFLIPKDLELLKTKSQCYFVCPTHLSGLKKEAWKNFYEKNLMAIGWEDEDYSDKNIDEILPIYKDYTDLVEATEAFRNIKSIKYGDIICCTNNNHGIFGIGVALSGYKYESQIHCAGKDSKEAYYYSHYVDVAWISYADDFNFIKSQYFISTNSEKRWEPYGTLTSRDRIPTYINNYLFMNNTETTMEIDTELAEYIEILKYKKQIILQGAPGTGKTRLAKQMAAEMTKSKSDGDPKKSIDLFFINFDSQSKIVQNKRESTSKLLATFKSMFPAEAVKNLTLENYVLGTGSQETFCWWIERGLKPLGYYFPGSARTYLIYWSKQKVEYSTHYKNYSDLVNAPSVESAMKIIAAILSEVVTDQNIATAEKVLGNSLILKLLHTYYPDDYFPVNSEVCLRNILKLIGVDSSKLNFIEKNKKVQEYFLKKKNELKADVTNIEFMEYLFHNYNLKGDVIVESDSLLVQGDYKIIQFHPSYTYEDFVRGIIAETNDNGGIEYKVVNKVLAESAQIALDNPKANYVLIIDEINRANLSTVLGELIYALEYRYDEENQSETIVNSIYGLKTEKDDESCDFTLKLPNNLYIIGTMNTADRSAAQIDYAIRRRFTFVDVKPKELNEVSGFNVDIFKQVASLFIKNYEVYLEDPDCVLSPSDYLSDEFRPEDVWLGHSYFIMKDKDGKDISRFKINFEIIPILKEYLKDGIFKNRTVIEDFIKNIKV